MYPTAVIPEPDKNPMVLYVAGQTTEMGSTIINTTVFKWTQSKKETLWD
jgi:hypothetical protein